MALGTYAQLKDSIVTWSKRKDATVGILDDFILIAEEEMFGNPDSPLRLNAMDTRATASASTSERFLALPDRFISMRRLKLNLAQGDTDVKFMSPEE